MGENILPIFENYYLTEQKCFSHHGKVSEVLTHLFGLLFLINANENICLFDKNESIKT